jgi:signal peptidase II
MTASLAVVVAIADQAAKVLVASRFELGERLAIVVGFFDLTYVLNPGGVWGLGRDLPDLPRTLLFIALPVTITLFAAWYAWSLPAGDRVRHVAIGMVVGGAVGNLVDRLRLDPTAVIDFLLFHLRGNYWPAFNVADSAICIGVAILLASSFIVDDDEPQVVQKGG